MPGSEHVARHGCRAACTGAARFTMLVWSRGRASLPLGPVPSWRASTGRASVRPDLMKLHVWCDTCRTMSAGPWLQGPSSRGSQGISTMAPSRSSHGAEQSCHPLIHGHDLEPDLGTRPPAPVSLFQLTPRLPTSAPNPLFLLLPIASPAPFPPRSRALLHLPPPLLLLSVHPSFFSRAPPRPHPSCTISRTGASFEVAC